MRIAVIGTGAVGGYYGSLLVRCGYDVHFLLRSDFEYVRDNGLQVDSVGGDFIVHPVHAYGQAKDMPPCDIVVVALKTTQNHGLVDILPRIVGAGGIVVVLQNGLDVEADIQGIVPDATVIGGLCFLCCQKTGQGHLRHLDHGAIRFGQYFKDRTAGGITPVLEEVAGIFSRAGVPVRLAENLSKARWEKLVWNMGFNGPAVILNATTHDILRHAASRSIVRNLMQEVIAGANASGMDIHADFSDQMIKVTEKMIDYSPSMKFDHESGKPMEVEAIYWRPVHAASSHGMNMEQSRLLACQLTFLNERMLNTG